MFVVIGVTGEYSDRLEWLVCAYEDESLARAHAERAQAEAKRIEAMTERYGREPDDAAKIWDAEMSMAYTGTSYYVQACELRSALPA